MKIDILLKSNTSTRYQKGVVLFIAMIALVVMSLAAVALIRSVDTNSLITGNLSYKQTSVTSGSYGVESFANTLGMRLKDDVYPEADDRPNGYYATCANNITQANEICDGGLLTQDDTWSAANTSRLATISTLLEPGKDAYGNTIEYIVERMCTAAGPANKTNCLVARRSIEGDSHDIPNEPIHGAPLKPSDLPVYRVTVRVTGPKNTSTYIQAFIS